MFKFRRREWLITWLDEDDSGLAAHTRPLNSKHRYPTWKEIQIVTGCENPIIVNLVRLLTKG